MTQVKLTIGYDAAFLMSAKDATTVLEILTSSTKVETRWGLGDETAVAIAHTEVSISNRFGPTMSLADYDAAVEAKKAETETEVLDA